MFFRLSTLQGTRSGRGPVYSVVMDLRVFLDAKSIAVSMLNLSVVAAFPPTLTEYTKSPELVVIKFLDPIWFDG